MSARNLQRKSSPSARRRAKVQTGAQYVKQLHANFKRGKNDPQLVSEIQHFSRFTPLQLRQPLSELRTSTPVERISFKDFYAKHYSTDVWSDLIKFSNPGPYATLGLATSSPTVSESDKKLLDAAHAHYGAPKTCHHCNADCSTESIADHQMPTKLFGMKRRIVIEEILYDTSVRFLSQVWNKTGKEYSIIVSFRFFLEKNLQPPFEFINIRDSGTQFLFMQCPKCSGKQAALMLQLPDVSPQNIGVSQLQMYPPTRQNISAPST